MKLVILDREGVVNHVPDGYVLRPDQFVPLPGSLEAIARLHPPDGTPPPVRGRIDAIAICPHSPEQQCGCRKPKPGMLLELMARFGAAPEVTTMIGDTPADLLAGRAAGCRTLLVRSGYGRSTIDSGQLPPQVDVCDDLSAATQLLLATSSPDRPAP